MHIKINYYAMQRNFLEIITIIYKYICCFPYVNSKRKTDNCLNYNCLY